MAFENALDNAIKVIGGVYDQNKLYPKVRTVFTNKFKDNDDYYNPAGDQVVFHTVAAHRGKATDTARDSLASGKLPTGFTEKLVTLPNHNREDIISADMLQKRMAGSLPFIRGGGSHSMSNALAHCIQKVSQQHLNEIAASMEYMSIQALLTGQLTFENNEDIDFGLPDEQNIIPTVAWSDAAGDPMDDIDKMMTLLELNSAEVEFDVYMGSKALVSFMNNEKVSAYYQKYAQGYTNPIFNGTGRDSNNTQRLPSISTPSGFTLNIHTYHEFYDTIVSNKKVSYRFFDEDKVLILGKSAGLSKARGVPSVMPSSVSTMFGTSHNNVLVANGGSIIQTILPAEDTGIKIRTRSCQAPVVLSCDKIGVLTVA